MTIGQIIALIAAFGTILGIIVTIMLVGISQSAKGTRDLLTTHENQEKENDKKVIDGITDITKAMASLSKEISDFKVSISDNYVKKIDLQRVDEKNDLNHVTFWKEINRVNSCIVAMATKFEFDLSKILIKE